MTQDPAAIAAKAARFKKLYTAAVYDILDEMGLSNQCMDLGIRALDRSSWAYVGVWSYDYDARLPLVTQPVLLAQHAEAIAEYSKAAMRLLADGHVVELSRFHRDLLELPEAIAALAECMRDFLVSRSSKGRNP